MEEAAALVHQLAPKAYFHTDAIQAYGKYQIRPKRSGIDLLSVSGHKIHGPKGTGFLYVNEKVKIHPLILGGGQQKGMRSGTDNVPGIAGLGAAAADCYQDFEAKQKNLRSLRNYFIEEVAKLPDVQVNGPKEEEKAAPSDRQRELSRRAERGAAPCAGGAEDLCVFRFCLLFQQEAARERGAQRDPSGVRFT